MKDPSDNDTTHNNPSSSSSLESSYDNPLEDEIEGLDDFIDAFPMDLSIYSNNSDRIIDEDPYEKPLIKGWNKKTKVFRETTEVDSEFASWIRGKDNRGRKKRYQLLRAVSEEQVYGLFKDAINKHSDYWLVFRSDNIDSFDSFATRSNCRWNLKSDKYRNRIINRLNKETTSLRGVTHLVLTYSPSRVRPHNDCYPYLDDIGFMVYKCWEHMGAFLDRLRQYRRVRKQKWNWITTVLEFQENGSVHFHLLFYGKWVAPIDHIQRMWGWCERNGIEVKYKDQINIIAYLCKYLGKARKCINSKNEVHSGYAWVYYFAVRLFNVRHNFRDYSRREQAQKWVCIGLVYMGDKQFWYGEVDIKFKRHDENYADSEDKFWDDP